MLRLLLGLRLPLAPPVRPARLVLRLLLVRLLVRLAMRLRPLLPPGHLLLRPLVLPLFRQGPKPSGFLQTGLSTLPLGRLLHQLLRSWRLQLPRP